MTDTQREVLGIIAEARRPITINQIRELMSRQMCRQWVELMVRKFVESGKVRRFGVHGDNQGYSYEVI
jgi:GMP synthase PP-ATPase subunit